MKGREILQSTVDLVQNILNLEVASFISFWTSEWSVRMSADFPCLRCYIDWYGVLFVWQVIYGDTDSIMIYTGLDDIGKAKAIAGKVIQEVGLIVCSFFW